jgi:hypothetical protein
MHTQNMRKHDDKVEKKRGEQMGRLEENIAFPWANLTIFSFSFPQKLMVF